MFLGHAITSIATLYSLRQTLVEEHGGPWVACYSCYATDDEIQNMFSPHSGGLNGEWGDVDARNNVGIIIIIIIIYASFVAEWTTNCGSENIVYSKDLFGLHY